MPLSEHEQRLLDQIERALYAEDPKFASTVKFSDLRTHRRRRIRRAAIVFVLGLGVLIAGAVLNELLVGVGGFVLMLVAGLVVARTLQRKRPAERSQRDTPPHGEKRGLFGRVEDRWQRRWDEPED